MIEVIGGNSFSRTTPLYKDGTVMLMGLNTEGNLNSCGIIKVVK